MHLNHENNYVFFSVSALKIHCSSQCKALLDRLKGYKLVERGLVGMKGKGDVLTYWLIGEETEWRKKRNEEREKRRSEANSKHLNKKMKNSNKTDSNGYPIGCPRSSLKNKVTIMNSPRSNLSRCASLESPKKLRFASNHNLEFSNTYHKCSRDPLLEVITDNSPNKRNSSCITDPPELVCDSHLSASCPCIESFPPSPKAVTKFLTLPKIDVVDKSSSNSEPVLFNPSPVTSDSGSALLDPLFPMKQFSDEQEPSCEEVSEGISLLCKNESSVIV